MKIYYCEQFPEEVSQHRLAYFLLEQALDENEPELKRLTGNEKTEPCTLRGEVRIEWKTVKDGGELEKESRKYRYERTPFGKPYLADYPQIQFNISHCASCVACAVGEEPMGIDVERRFPWKENLVRRVCHPGEREFLMQLASEQERVDSLNLIWSRKESFLKCIGTGIRRDLREFQVWYGAGKERQAGPETSAQERGYGEEWLGKREEWPGMKEESIWIGGEKYLFREMQNERFTLSACCRAAEEE